VSPDLFSLTFSFFIISMANDQTKDEPGKYADKNSQIGEIILFSADLQQFEEQMTEVWLCSKRT
jgi:hypothetical protein